MKTTRLWIMMATLAWLLPGQLQAQPWPGGGYGRGCCAGTAMPQTAQAHFQTMDQNGDGIVTRAELTQQGPPMRANHFLATHDSNGDGQVTQGEFMATIPANRPGWAGPVR
ncbi:MAG: hypothetical protein HQL58_00805 [Magnetococcales bacterium]|nr:hypothetical protein [Magnetococcales bacterium]